MSHFPPCEVYGRLETCPTGFASTTAPADLARFSGSSYNPTRAFFRHTTNRRRAIDVVKKVSKVAGTQRGGGFRHKSKLAEIVQSA